MPFFECFENNQRRSWFTVLQQVFFKFVELVVCSVNFMGYLQKPWAFDGDVEVHFIKAISFFYQTTKNYIFTNQNEPWKNWNFKETAVDKILHYFITICNIQAVRDYKKFKCDSLFQIYWMFLFIILLGLYH